MIRTIAILVLLAATAANAQLTTTVKRIRLEHATAAELAGTTLDLGHAVFNEENPADLRIGDGATPGGIRVGSDWWTNNMLTAWGGLSRVEVEALLALSIPHVDLTPYALSADLLDYARLSDYAAATNAIWGSLASKAAASNLVAEVSRLDGRVDGISAASLGALTVESDPEWSAASPDVARLRDVEALLALSIGAYQERDTAALAALDAQVGRLDGRIDNLSADGLGAITAEADPIFAASAAYGITLGNLAAWNAAHGWGDHAQAGYLTEEADPAWAAAAPKYARLRDVEALVALSIPYVDLTPYALSADLLDYARLSDYAAATNAIWGSLASKAAASNLVAEASRLDGRIDGISAASLGALTEEADPVWAATSPDVARLRDVEALLALSLGYFQEKDTAALSAVAAVSGRVDTVEGWGDHSEAGYATTKAAGEIATNVVGAATNALLNLAGTRAMTGDGVTLARDVKSRDAASVGDYGAAFGYYATAGNYGAAFGASTTAGDYGFAAGAGTSAGEAGFAAGADTSAGDYGFAAGEGASAGYAGFAAGSGTTAGDYGFAAGAGTSAGEAGFAAGYNTSADFAGFAAGLGTSAGDYGFAAGAGTSAGDFGFAAGRAAKGALGSFVFADSAPVAFDRTNSPNSFSVRAAGGTYFDTPLFTVTGEVAVESNLVVGNGQVFLNSSGTSWLQLDGTNIQFRATNGVTGRIQIIYE